MSKVQRPRFKVTSKVQGPKPHWTLDFGLWTFLFVCISVPVFSQSSPATSRITVDSKQRFQIIDGFGVNFNGTYFRDAQKPMIDRLIDDLGATIFRLDPYGISNWEAVNDNDDPNVMNWEYYNDRYSIPTFEAAWAAARYLNSRRIRPFLTLSGTAPDWMLDDKVPPPEHTVCRGSGSMNHKEDAKPNHLSPAMYEEFAEEIASLAVYARAKARIDFEYFGPVNETDCYPAEGPRIDPEEMPKVLSAIALRLKREGLGDLKLVVAEQARLPNDYIGPILDEPELMKQVGVFSLHTYGKESLAQHVTRVQNSKYSMIPIWLTEYGDLKDLDKSAENEWKGFSLAASERALRALNEGASAALFWDAYDNYHEHYPRLTFYGLVQNTDHIYAPKKRYYAAKQLYHFVRPGSQRVGAASEAPGLLVSAFRNASSGSLTVVGVKQGGPNRLQIVLSPTTQMPAVWHLYETTRSLDCLKVDNLIIKDGVASFDLPDEVVFTLVGTIPKEN
jgi:O-glycosyl hydrolase